MSTTRSGAASTARCPISLMARVVRVHWDARAPATVPISVLYVMPIMITVWLRSRRARLRHRADPQHLRAL